jgi:hypothetical protein
MMYNSDVYTETGMRENMVRKQIYLPRKQDQILKRLARQRGISEAEVIRQALERDEKAVIAPVRNGAAGWEDVLRFVRERQAAYTGKGKPVRWNRQDLYEEPGKGQ